MLDRKDLKVSPIAPEDIAPSSKQSIESPSTDNNNGNTSPSSSLANISVDPEFAYLL